MEGQNREFMPLVQATVTGDRVQGSGFRDHKRGVT